MRTLFVLIKRQVRDNAAHFAIAGVAAVSLAFAVAAATFTEDRTDLSPYTRILFVTSPLLVGIGSCALGLVQGRADRISGIGQVLSALPVSRGQILFAQTLTGALVIVTVLALPAVMGTLLWRLYGPPDWLFHPWIADSFVGSSLTAFACYLLGLSAGKKPEAGISILFAALTLLLLLPLRGLGAALLAVLVPLIVALLLQCWKLDTRDAPAVVSAGFIILVCLGTLLSSGQYLCNGCLVAIAKPSTKIRPSGLLGSNVENDPNISRQSEVYGSVDVHWWRRPGCPVCTLCAGRRFGNRKLFEIRHYLLENSGIVEYFLSRRRGGTDAYSLRTRSPRPPYGVIHLDEVEGRLLYRRSQTRKPGNPRTWQWLNTSVTYGGPNSVSSDPNIAGRFSSPTTYFERGSTPRGYWRLRHCVVYDRHSRRFYDIDFERETVRKGPEVQDSTVGPIDLNRMRLSGGFLSTGFFRPSIRDHRSRFLFDVYTGDAYLPLVDESGRIYLLEQRTLAPTGPAGFLPAPRTPFGRGSSKARDLMDYDVEAISVVSRGTYPGSSEIKTGFVGIVAASVSRQGMWTSVAVFDDKGNLVNSSSSQLGLFDKPLNSTLSVTKYMLESLHPPVLTLASFFTAYSFEARASHRALFVMPNSFAAMVRDRHGNIVVTLAILLLVMLPGLALAGWLGYLVARDATTIGLPLGARRIWLATTILFGLAGYITYRLTQPKVTLVTCPNCGKGRRPDMDTCHHCGGKWKIPELKPPAWRVLTHGD